VAPSSIPNALLATHDVTSDPGASAAVDLSGVTRVFDATPAVVRVDLRVDRGEAVLVRGPNGAGKSTLLAIVATLLSTTYGSGTVLGFDLERERDEIRRRIDLLGHRTRLYEDLTARENLRFACALYGVEAERVDEALATVGLADVGGERVRGFSHGMRQRVAVARTLLREPELVLLDEPYAGLDEDARRVVDALIRGADASGRTVIMATHDEGAELLVRRTIRMKAGAIVGDRRTEAVPHTLPRGRE
jgi:heme ABC exporter ATP-binding subunit CcmA